VQVHRFAKEPEVIGQDTVLHHHLGNPAANSSLAGSKMCFMKYQHIKSHLMFCSNSRFNLHWFCQFKSCWGCWWRSIKSRRASLYGL
jgi:hypothetical protein